MADRKSADELERLLQEAIQRAKDVERERQDERRPTESDNIDCASVWGDFVGLDDEGEVEDACEPIERYEEGLYYPVCIGEVLIDRYCVEHKLGHSGFSTVWMAYNMLSNNNIALKIISPGPSGEREYTTQTMIASTV
ncbi:uncharacterized protein FFB20_12466 [Fusarium fujikuroi]|nr:uncharacterized protein FFB20_12466 [Fusarium fujikuroi]SCO18765.1 uncharacterized protein FFE2_14181 [Fusarium fujikuroi]